MTPPEDQRPTQPPAARDASPAAAAPLPQPLPAAPGAPTVAEPSGRTPTEMPRSPAAAAARTELLAPGAEARPQPPAPPAAAEEFGPYRLLSELGRGGMGVVYRAFDTRLERTVALKRLLGEGDGVTPDAIERFLREARSAARLRHPHIVAVHEVGALAGRHFFTMELIEGRSLAQALAAGGLARRDVLEALFRSAQAVGYAHREGVVHRDLKPENLLLDAAGKTYVTDFGLAKEFGRDTARLTASGAIVGTPNYMSPEQVRGRRGVVGPPSDVWSLGVILYQVLTRRLPFDAHDLQGILTAIVDTEPTPPSRAAAAGEGGGGGGGAISRDLETVCLRCLEKDAARRYPTGAELAEDLRRVLDGEPILAARASRVRLVWRRAVRARRVLLPTAAALLLALGWLVSHYRATLARAAEIGARIHSARRLAVAGRLDEAQAAFAAALLMQPGNLDVQLGAAEVAARRGAAEHARERERAEAVKLLEQARPGFDAALLFLYPREPSAAETARRIEAAQGLIDLALEKDPGLAPAHYLQGVGWELLGRPERAEPSWRKALAIDPAFGPARYRLGRLLCERAYLARVQLSLTAARHLAQDAETELDAALDSRSGFDDRRQRHLAAALSAYLRDDWEGARARCEQALAERSSAPSAPSPPAPAGGDGGSAGPDAARGAEAQEGTEDLHWLLGVIEMDCGGTDPQRRRLDRAIAAFDRAVAIRPRYALARFSRGIAHVLRGDNARSLADFAVAIAANPRFAAAYQARSFTHAQRRDLVPMAQDFEAALLLNPRFVLRFYGISYDLLSLRLRRPVEIVGATRSPEPPPLPEKATADELCRRAIDDYRRGDARACFTHLDRALAADPRLAAAHVVRGDALLARGDLPGAAAALERAVAIDPDHAEAHYLLGITHDTAGDADRALAEYEEALRRRPGYAHALANRALVLVRRRRYAEAVRDYSEALKQLPNYAQLWFARGMARYRRGDVAGAITDLTEGLKLASPVLGTSFLARAEARLADGDDAEALLDLGEALRIDAGLAEAWRLRGDVRARRGEWAEAAGDFAAALRHARPDWAARGATERALAEAERRAGEGKGGPPEGTGGR
ncbi:MAG: protein kinase [Planctomycetes bacterium]|nr:protein kinase [Planctomycetota bacterium]